MATKFQFLRDRGIVQVSDGASGFSASGMYWNGSNTMYVQFIGLNGVNLSGTGGTVYQFTFPADGGTSGYVLSTDGTGTTSWVPQSSATGTVTSVAISSTDGSITVNSGSPITSSGTIDLTVVNFWTPSSTDIFNNNSGNVGIGTSSPAYKLDVSGAMHASGGAVFGAPVTLPSYLVAGLPAAGAGATAYASDGRKAGEGTGSGTGIPVWCDGTDWRTYYDNSVALS